MFTCTYSAIILFRATDFKTIKIAFQKKNLKIKISLICESVAFFFYFNTLFFSNSILSRFAISNPTKKHKSATRFILSKLIFETSSPTLW